MGIIAYFYLKFNSFLILSEEIVTAAIQLLLKEQTGFILQLHSLYKLTAALQLSKHTQFSLND